MRASARLFALLMLVGISTEWASAQPGDEGFEGRRGRGGRGFSMEQFDANGNGLLEPEEVPERMKPFIDRAAERAGVAPGAPIPLSELRRGRGERSGDGDRGPRRGDERRPAGENSGDSKPANAPAANTQPGNTQPPMGDGTTPAANSQTPMSGGAQPTPAEASQGKPEPAKSEPVKPEPVKPLVPGFGVESKLSPVAGFAAPTKPGGDAAAAPTAAAAPAAGEQRPGGDDSNRERVERFATSLLRQYDTNKNGTLERDEWKNMRGNPQETDKNGDGVITLEELTERMASFGQRRPGEGGGGEGAGKPGEPRGEGRGPRGGGPPTGGFAKPASQPAAVESVARPRRFVTPASRLPEGLPSWFSQRDADGDGQVAMAEFATSWTEAKAAEFAGFDRNSDGLLSPQEALAAQ